MQSTFRDDRGLHYCLLLSYWAYEHSNFTCSQWAVHVQLVLKWGAVKLHWQFPIGVVIN